MGFLLRCTRYVLGEELDVVENFVLFAFVNCPHATEGKKKETDNASVSYGSL
jgi:hypothetical protein